MISYSASSFKHTCAEPVSVAIFMSKRKQEDLRRIGASIYRLEVDHLGLKFTALVPRPHDHDAFIRLDL